MRRRPSRPTHLARGARRARHALVVPCAARASREIGRDEAARKLAHAVRARELGMVGATHRGEHLHAHTEGGGAQSTAGWERSLIAPGSGLGRGGYASSGQAQHMPTPAERPLRSCCRRRRGGALGGTDGPCFGAAWRRRAARPARAAWRTRVPTSSSSRPACARAPRAATCPPRASTRRARTRARARSRRSGPAPSSPPTPATR